jgi:hypothetical protein
MVFAWVAWAVLSRVTIVESSREFSINRDGTLQVSFPAQSMGRIQPGQQATLRVEGAGAFPSRSGEVIDVNGTAGQKQVKIFVGILPVLPTGVSGEINIVVSRVSPLNFLIRGLPR